MPTDPSNPWVRVVEPGPCDCHHPPQHHDRWELRATRAGQGRVITDAAIRTYGRRTVERLLHGLPPLPEQAWAALPGDTAAAAAPPPGGTSAVIVCVAMPGWWVPGHPLQADVSGQYLAAYDPDDRAGGWRWSPDLADAMVFADAGAAYSCWTAVCSRQPVRPDGQPNRPLTAFTVAMIPQSEAAQQEQQS
jgi:hypothetical protein